MAQQFKNICLLCSDSAHMDFFFFFFLTFSDFWQMLNEAINQMMCLWKVQNLN